MNRIARWARQFGWRGRCAWCCCSRWCRCALPIRGRCQELRLRTFDFFRCCGPAQQTSLPVVIVDIDEASLKIDRAVAMAAHHDRRSGDAHYSARRASPSVSMSFSAEPDRMSPAVAEQAFAVSTRKPAPSSIALPSNDDVFADAIKHSHVVVGQVGSAVPTPRTEADAALQTGFAVRRTRSDAVSGDFPRSAAQHLPIEQAACRPRLVLDQSGDRRHHSPRAGDDGRRRATWCRR